tara:strand:+ start:3178 stop:3351 length:174 start_codon:yes stop_codon:yes gene_type:complete
LLLDKEDQTVKINNMDLLVFLVGFGVFSLYLLGYVLVITNQNKIQDEQDKKDPELNN